MTDREKFESFFREMGISFDAYDLGKEPELVTEERPTEDSIPKKSAWMLCVSQAQFIFDADGHYLGVLSDDTNEWEPRN